MVPEVSSETDKVFCHFGPFFALLPRNDPQNQNFAPNKTKNQNVKTMKKTPGDVIILQMCTTNYDHMMYSF